MEPTTFAHARVTACLSGCCHPRENTKAIILLVEADEAPTWACSLLEHAIEDKGVLFSLTEVTELRGARCLASRSASRSAPVTPRLCYQPGREQLRALAASTESI